MEEMFNFDEFEESEVIEDVEEVEAEELSEEEMEDISGGAGTKLSNKASDKYHYRGNFVRRKVWHVKNLGKDSELTIRRSPGGEIFYGYGWQNGETILVNKYTSTWSKDKAWVFAYSTKKGGIFGYVDKRYIKGL